MKTLYCPPGPNLALALAEAAANKRARPRYVRSTEDVWDVEGNYGHGWECVTRETSRAEAKDRLKEYRDNEPGPFRLVKRRVKKEA